VGIMGFSAGAHLCATLGSKNTERHYPAVDAADQQSCRPDFTMLIYPAYLTLEKENDRVAPEVAVTSATPPTFLVQTEDDPIRPECSLGYYLALKQAKVPAELHLYPTGGHGYGLRPTDVVCTTWPKRTEEWLRGQGFLKPANR
jgi:acetyl esterase/lipase